jgi:hypothetical protein
MTGTTPRCDGEEQPVGVAALLAATGAAAAVSTPPAEPEAEREQEGEEPGLTVLESREAA